MLQKTDHASASLPLISVVTAVFKTWLPHPRIL